MSLKNALTKAAGLFVEIPPDVAEEQATPVRTVEEVVRQAPGPNLDQIQTPTETAKAPPIGADGKPDFKAIFDLSGVPTVGFGADEALQVINSLPPDLPINVKRTTVGATLGAMGKAMGVSTDSVVADASRKIAALASFTDQITAQTQQYQGLIQQKIGELKAQIADFEQKSAEAEAKRKGVVEACEAEGDRLDDVLEFFTSDAPPSKHA